MDLESLGYPNLEVPSSNLRVSLTPKILDVSRVQALGWVQVSLGIGDQSSNSQLSETKKGRIFMEANIIMISSE